MVREGVGGVGRGQCLWGYDQGRMFRVTVQDRWESVGTVTLANKS